MAIFADKRNGKVTGRWRVELQLNGQRVRKRFDTIEEARKYETDARKEMEAGRMPLDARARTVAEKPVATLGDLCRAVEGHLWAGTNTERTAHLRLGAAVRILGPNVLVESVTNSDIDRMVKFLRDRGKANGTINRYMSALSSALKWAVRRGLRNSPLPEFTWEDEDEGRIRWITPAEEEQLLSLLPRSEALAAFICIRTGLRRGELIGLKPRDVETGWVRLWGTGTKNGTNRSIPLLPDVYTAILELFRIGMPSRSSLRYHWETAKKAMGLEADEEFVFHATRHTFATRAVQSGVHVRVLQRLMGHKHITTTMRYMQVNDAMLTAAIDLMGERGAMGYAGSTGSYLQGGPREIAVGALQRAEEALNRPLSTAGDLPNNVRYQGVSVVSGHGGADLGSSAARLASSSLAARTTRKKPDDTKA